MPEGLSVARVAQLVVEGGHDVPEEKIRQPLRRLWTYVADATERAYETRACDSSGQSGKDFVEVARYQYVSLLGDAR